MFRRYWNIRLKCLTNKARNIPNPSRAHVHIQSAGPLSYKWNTNVSGVISISRFWITARRHLSTRTRNQAVPVIIPLSGGTWSVLIRCMRAETQYLVSPQMRLENQAASAATATATAIAAVRCLCFWILIMKEMIYSQVCCRFLECTKSQEDKSLKVYLGCVCGFFLESQDFASTVYT